MNIKTEIEPRLQNLIDSDLGSKQIFDLIRSGFKSLSISLLNTPCSISGSVLTGSSEISPFVDSEPGKSLRNRRVIFGVD